MIFSYTEIWMLEGKGLCSKEGKTWNTHYLPEGVGSVYFSVNEDFKMLPESIHLFSVLDIKWKNIFGEQNSRSRKRWEQAEETG